MAMQVRLVGIGRHNAYRASFDVHVHVHVLYYCSTSIRAYRVLSVSVIVTKS